MNHLLNVATVCALCLWKHVTSSSAVCGLSQCSFWCLIRWSWGHLEWVKFEVTILKQWRTQSLLTKLSFFFPNVNFLQSLPDFLSLLFRWIALLFKYEWMSGIFCKIIKGYCHGKEAGTSAVRTDELIAGTNVYMSSAFHFTQCQSNQPLHGKI